MAYRKEDQLSFFQAKRKYQASSDYAKILAGMGEVLRGIEFNEKYINSLLEICEAWLSFIPSSTNLSEAADISLFDHAKITAALASAIVLYLESQGRFDYRKELLKKVQISMKKMLLPCYHSIFQGYNSLFIPFPPRAL